MKKKYDYISIMNAIAIIAVIIGHVDVTGVSVNDPNTPIANILSDLGSFQMPLFMFISGFLFVRTSGFSKSYLQLIKNKAHRLLVPFLFLSIFTLCFKLCIPSDMLEHSVSISFDYIFRLFFVPLRGPVPHLWFVISLFTLFLLTPIFKLCLQRHIDCIVMILLLIALSIITPMIMNDDFEILAINKTFNFAIWFYLGIVFAKLDLDKYGWAWSSTISLCLLYVLFLFFIKIPFISGFMSNLFGVLFIFSLSKCIVKLNTNCFATWRNYTYQIYLLHMYTITAFKLLYKRHLITNEDLWFWMLWILSIVCAIIFPTLIAKTIEKMPICIKQLIGL